jgi:hypothetical protein
VLNYSYNDVVIITIIIITTTIIIITNTIIIIINTIIIITYTIIIIIIMIIIIIITYLTAILTTQGASIMKGMSLKRWFCSDDEGSTPGLSGPGCGHTMSLYRTYKWIDR